MLWNKRQIMVKDRKNNKLAVKNEHPNKTFGLSYFVMALTNFLKYFLRDVNPLTFIRIQGSKKDININIIHKFTSARILASLSSSRSKDSRMRPLLPLCFGGWGA